MASILVTPTPPVAPATPWRAGDVVRLRLGSEEAPSLAASTPPGGRVAASASAAGPDGQAVSPTLSAIHAAQDKSAVLPLGVEVVDAAGNASDPYEGFVQLADPPAPAGRPTVAATANPPTPGEALITFSPSPDVEVTP